MKTLIESDGKEVKIKLVPENPFEIAIVDSLNLTNSSVNIQKNDDKVLILDVNSFVK